MSGDPAGVAGSATDARTVTGYGWLARVGAIVPSVNVAVEGDLQRMVPAGVSVHIARMPYDRRLPPVAALDRQAAGSVGAARDLASAGVAAIAYACTSGSFFKGLDWEEALRSDLEQAAGCPVVMTGSACLQALEALAVRRVCVVTPYAAEVNDRLAAYLRAAGFEPLAIAGTTSSGPPPTVTADELIQAVRAAWRPGADALLVACTGFHALDLIAPLEAELGRPVVTSNQATGWALLHTAGVESKIPGYGRLMGGETAAGG